MLWEKIQYIKCLRNKNTKINCKKNINTNFRYEKVQDQLKLELNTKSNLHICMEHVFLVNITLIIMHKIEQKNIQIERFW